MKSIQLVTPQQVYIEYQLATLGERFGAKMIDGLLFFLGYYLLINFFFSLFDLVLGRWGEMSLFVFVPIFGFLLYHFLFEFFKNGQTPGKKLLSLRVVPLGTWEPEISHYALRAVFLLPDFLFSSGIFGALFISGTSLRQRMGDMVASTAVVRIKTSGDFTLQNIININERRIKEIRYPKLKELNDHDMLVVKETLQRYRQFNNAAHYEALQQLRLKMCEILEIPAVPARESEKFLKSLLKEYILLTR